MVDSTEADSNGLNDLTMTDAKWVLSRLSFDVAAAIKEADGKLHIDDAIIIAATPSVLMDYKNVEERALKRIHRMLKYFFKKNPRYLDFTKEAVAEGLRKEWLPELEDDTKVSLLSDFRLTPGVDEYGFVIYNPEMLANLTRTEHPDRERYGKNPYSPRPARGSASKRECIILTEAKPDANLAEKLAPYIKWYKENWAKIHPLENYKWEAVKHFQKNWNIDASDFAGMLREAFSKASNLLATSMYMPLSMLLKHAEINPDEVRGLFVNLYDETKPFAERTNTFLDDFRAMHRRNAEAGLIKKHTDQQSDRATSVYLAFRYPAKHYLYKMSVWNDFKDEVGIEYDSLNHFPSKLFGYELMADQVREVLMADSELMVLLTQSQPDDMSDGHLLTQDFLYAVAVHLTGINNESKN